MDNLLKQIRKNVGGMLRFYWWKKEEIATLPAAGFDKIISSAPTLITGAHIFTGYCTQGKNGYKEDCVQDGNGVKYKIQFKGFIPDMAPDRSITIEELNLWRLIALCMDNNKRLVMLGTLENPCRFVADFDSEKTFAGYKGHEVTLYWEHLFKPPFYEAAIATGGGGGT